MVPSPVLPVKVPADRRMSGRRARFCAEKDRWSRRNRICNPSGGESSQRGD